MKIINTRIIISHEFRTKSNTINLKELGLNDRQIDALTLIVNDNCSFSIKDYVEYFKVSRYTASRDLNDLTEKNLLDKYRNKYNKKILIFGNKKDQ